MTARTIINVVSVPQWAGLAGLADDGMSIATARKLIADGTGPEVVEIKRQTRNGPVAVEGVRLRDHKRWARSKPWAKYLTASAAAERDKRRSKRRTR
jgi:hypothetical protein